MSELADQLSQEAETGVSPAEIPADQPARDSGGSERSPPEKPVSLREQITKSVEAVRKEEATRARDVATGKFAKADGAAGTASAAPEKPATPEIPKPAVEAKPSDSIPDAPPSAWKGIWDNLTPEAKAIAVRREAEVTKGFEEYRGKTAQLQEIAQAFDPIRPLLQQSGIQSDAAAVKQLLQWEGSFRNPATRIQAFHQLAQQYGVDINSLVQNPSQPSAAQDIPEPLRPVLDKFGQIEQTVGDLKAQLQRADQDRVSSQLEAFAKDKPHFEKVRVIMGQLMNAGIVQPGDLEGAYQKATALHPEVSAQIKADEEAKRIAELAKANADKANRARQAAISPGQRSPAVAASGTKSKPSSVKESILASVAALREGQRA